MQDKQRVADMAVEVVDRQARVRAEWTGEPLDEAGQEARTSSTRGA